VYEPQNQRHIPYNILIDRVTRKCEPQKRSFFSCVERKACSDLRRSGSPGFGLTTNHWTIIDFTTIVTAVSRGDVGAACLDDRRGPPQRWTGEATAGFDASCVGSAERKCFGNEYSRGVFVSFERCAFRCCRPRNRYKNKSSSALYTCKSLSPSAFSVLNDYSVIVLWGGGFKLGRAPVRCGGARGPSGFRKPD